VVAVDRACLLLFFEISLKHMATRFGMALGFLAAACGFSAMYLLAEGVYYSALSSPGERTVAAAQCVESASDPSVKSENPNKLLFVSCGGFLE
jgi:hypothetical protein